jgi:hypothetical protein
MQKIEIERFISSDLRDKISRLEVEIEKLEKENRRLKLYIKEDKK